MINFSKPSAYQKSEAELAAILEKETDAICKMATVVCVLKTNLPYYFWTGFYLVKNGELLIGPYQGTLGCLHIKFGRGVCGTAAQTLRTQVVPDVHEFSGHIACDSTSTSEIVVPVFNSQRELIGVFDVDSTEKNSFDKVDQEYLERILQTHFAISPLTF